MITEIQDCNPVTKLSTTWRISLHPGHGSHEEAQVDFYEMRHERLCFVASYELPSLLGASHEHPLYPDYSRPNCSLSGHGLRQVREWLHQRCQQRLH